jgi:DeoR family transcriptional regulator of aga operon
VIVDEPTADTAATAQSTSAGSTTPTPSATSATPAQPIEGSTGPTTAPVPARVRRDRMLDLVRQRDFVHVSELAETFRISEVTVRTDLDLLQDRGHLRRVRGGAVPRTRARAERPYEETVTANIADKRAIGEAAAAMVTSGDTVILDVGTTTTAVARALAARDDLSNVMVFTNALTIALELEAVAPRITVVVTGGTLRPLQHSLVDPLGGLILESINAGIVFLGCNGVDPDAGITNINLPEAQVKRRMLTAAQRRVVVADGSKVGEIALAHLADVDDVDLLLTSSNADPTLVDALRDRGLDVHVVPTEPT